MAPVRLCWETADLAGADVGGDVAVSEHQPIAHIRPVPAKFGQDLTLIVDGIRY